MGKHTITNKAQEKWDLRYRNSHNHASRIAEVLSHNRHRLPTVGKALDLATGLGSNALFLAHRGLEVHAWDISGVAIEVLNRRATEQGLQLFTQVRDCLSHPPSASQFDLIVVCRFLERELCPAISAALKPGGLLLYQTYTLGKERAAGPNNPRFLLARGELLGLFPDLEVIAYQEGEEAQLVGKRG